MAEETTNVSAQENPESATDYIQAINELKNNTVGRDKYDAVVAEKKQLIEALVSGQTLDAPAEPQGRSASEIRDDLTKNGPNMDNYSFVKASLELRDAVLSETGEDIFVAKGNKLTPSAQDYATAQQVADVFKECLEYSNGDSQLFTNELMRRTNDVVIPYR